jgi:hypothetical protein
MRLGYRSRRRRPSTGCAGPESSPWAEQGYEIDQIANDIGLSRQNVEHYMRFRDQMKVGATVKSGLVSSTKRTRPRTPARLYGRCKSPGLHNSRARLQTSEKSAVKSATSVGNGVTVAYRVLD